MSAPTVNAIINFSTGPSTAQAMQLDIGILGTNVLADSVAVIVDVSDRINRIETNRGRTALSDIFQTGSMTLRIVDQAGDFNPQNPSSPFFNLLLLLIILLPIRYFQALLQVTLQPIQITHLLMT
jgi:hypothetical protein